MPIIHRAIKKLRHDRKRAKVNAHKRATVRSAIKLARAKPIPKNLAAVYRVLDKAVKTKIIHANKAARLKSRLAKLLAK